MIYLVYLFSQAPLNIQNQDLLLRKETEKVMHNKMYSFVLADILLYRNYKIHNNPLALVLVLYCSLYTYRSIDKHQQA